MKNRLVLLIGICCLCVGFLNAQAGVPFYLDYLLGNESLIHPSTVGVSYSGKFRATLRGQWFGLEDAPMLQTVNAGIRLKGQQGVGLMFFNDRNGFHSQLGGRVSYAYHINLVRQGNGLNMLSFGIGAGLYQRSLDETQFELSYGDPLIEGHIISGFTGNIDAGISYRYFEFYAHLTAKNILVRGRNIYKSQNLSNMRRYILTLGHLIGKKKVFYDLSASVLLSELDRENLLDVSFRAFYNSTRNGNASRVGYMLWGGLAYRSDIAGGSSPNTSLVSVIIGADYRDMTFGYIYSIPIVINFTGGGLHQVMFGFRFLKKKEPYKCKCPSLF